MSIFRVDREPADFWRTAQCKFGPATARKDWLLNIPVVEQESARFVSQLVRCNSHDSCGTDCCSLMGCDFTLKRKGFGGLRTACMADQQQRGITQERESAKKKKNISKPEESEN
jgi:hypothetical protein